MKKYAQTVCILLIIISCTEELERPSDKVGNEQVVEPELQGHPASITTPNGIEVTFPVIDSLFHISWSRQGRTDTLYLSLPLVTGGNSSFPWLVSENEEYLYFKNGCGSPCWNGLVMPLIGEQDATKVEYPIAADLDNNTIAYISNNDQVVLLNLESRDKQFITTEKCSSAFLGYCIDTAYFKDGAVYYLWSEDAHMESGDEQMISEKIKWY